MVAISFTRFTRSRFFWKFSPWNLGLWRRQSSAGDVEAQLAGEEPAAERAVRDEGDPQFADSGKQLVLGVAPPERIFGL